MKLIDIVAASIAAAFASFNIAVYGYLLGDPVWLVREVAIAVFISFFLLGLGFRLGNEAETEKERKKPLIEEVRRSGEED